MRILTELEEKLQEFRDAKEISTQKREKEKQKQREKQNMDFRARLSRIDSNRRVMEKWEGENL